MKVTYKSISEKVDDINAGLHKIGLEPINLTSLGEGSYQLTVGDSGLHVIASGSLYEISLFLKGFHSMMELLEISIEKDNSRQRKNSTTRLAP